MYISSNTLDFPSRVKELATTQKSNNAKIRHEDRHSLPRSSRGGVSDPDIPDTLKFTRVPITVQEDCARRYALLGSVITDDMICAGALNETEDDACQVSMTALPVC